jgi:hypothetical protein
MYVTFAFLLYWIVFFYVCDLGFELKSFRLAKQVLYCLSHTFSPFCPSWSQSTILLISASQVARITGVSH